MTPEQAKQREKIREYMVERMNKIVKERREHKVCLPIGFHINGIPIYAEDDDNGTFSSQDG